jgi:hypothetical protein
MGLSEQSLELVSVFKEAGRNFTVIFLLNPILHTAWLDNHALTLKSNFAKYCFYEKSRFLHTFLKFCCESRKI